MVLPVRVSYQLTIFTFSVLSSKIIQDFLGVLYNGFLLKFKTDTEIHNTSNFKDLMQNKLEDF